MDSPPEGGASKGVFTQKFPKEDSGRSLWRQSAQWCSLQGVTISMKANRQAEEQLASLRRELAGIRRASLAASRKGDYMRVARLTAMAAGLNRAIIETEGLISPDLF